MKSHLLISTIVLPLTLLSCSRLPGSTAPHVGCRPDEIKISDDQVHGSTRSWTATCQGRTYFCSRTKRVTECRDADSPYASSENPPPPDLGKPKIADTDPPTGAAGFEFKTDLEAASGRCTAAGHTWTQISKDVYECSQPPEETGIPATVRVELCAGAVCGIRLLLDVEGVSPSDTVARYASLREALEQKYGDVYITASTGMSGDCGGAGLAACLKDGRAHSASKWIWRSGYTVELSIGKASGPTPAIEVWIHYRNPASRGRGKPKLDAL